MSELEVYQEFIPAWVTEINDEYDSAVDQIRNVAASIGRKLIKAKGNCDHGEWGKKTGRTDGYKSIFNFGDTSVKMFMAIASDEWLANGQHIDHLPPSWGTQYEVSCLEYDEKEAMLSDGTINPDMERKDITAWKRAQTKESVAGKSAALPEEQFNVIYADPPWSYNDKQAGTISDSYGGAEKHYPSMNITEICELPIKSMASDDAVLFLWVTSPLLPEGLKVVDAWGFKYKSAFIWDKVKHNMGHYNSVRHELLFICTRGSFTPEHVKLFDSVQSIERTDKHSEKPEEFRGIIETLYPNGKKIELFRRGDAPEGWSIWGNEADG